MSFPRSNVRSRSAHRARTPEVVHSSCPPPALLEACQRSYPEICSMLSVEHAAAARQHTLAWLLKTIEQVYSTRYKADCKELELRVEWQSPSRYDEALCRAPASSASAFVLSWCGAQWGVHHLVERAVWELMANAEAARAAGAHTSVQLFCAICSGAYDSDELQFFLFCRQLVLEELAKGAADRPPPPFRGASPGGLPPLYDASMSKRQCERVISQAFRPAPGSAPGAQPAAATARGGGGGADTVAAAAATPGILQAALLQLVANRFAEGRAAAAEQAAEADGGRRGGGAEARPQYQMDAYDFLKILLSVYHETRTPLGAQAPPPLLSVPQPQPTTPGVPEWAHPAQMQSRSASAGRARRPMSAGRGKASDVSSTPLYRAVLSAHVPPPKAKVVAAVMRGGGEATDDVAAWMPDRGGAPLEPPPPPSIEPPAHWQTPRRPHEDAEDAAASAPQSVPRLLLPAGPREAQSPQSTVLVSSPQPGNDPYRGGDGEHPSASRAAAAAAAERSSGAEWAAQEAGPGSRAEGGTGRSQRQPPPSTRFISMSTSTLLQAFLPQANGAAPAAAADEPHATQQPPPPPPPPPVQQIAQPQPPPPPPPVFTNAPGSAVIFSGVLQASSAPAYYPPHVQAVAAHAAAAFPAAPAPASSFVDDFYRPQHPTAFPGAVAAPPLPQQYQQPPPQQQQQQPYQQQQYKQPPPQPPPQQHQPPPPPQQPQQYTPTYPYAAEPILWGDIPVGGAVPPPWQSAPAQQPQRSAVQTAPQVPEARPSPPPPPATGPHPVLSASVFHHFQQQYTRGAYGGGAQQQLQQQQPAAPPQNQQQHPYDRPPQQVQPPPMQQQFQYQLPEQRYGQAQSYPQQQQHAPPPAPTRGQLLSSQAPAPRQPPPPQQAPPPSAPPPPQAAPAPQQPDQRYASWAPAEPAQQPQYQQSDPYGRSPTASAASSAGATAADAGYGSIAPADVARQRLVRSIRVDPSLFQRGGLGAGAVADTRAPGSGAPQDVQRQQPPSSHVAPPAAQHAAPAAIFAPAPPVLDARADAPGAAGGASRRLAASAHQHAEPHPAQAQPQSGGGFVFAPQPPPQPAPLHAAAAPAEDTLAPQAEFEFHRPPQAGQRALAASVPVAAAPPPPPLPPLQQPQQYQQQQIRQQPPPSPPPPPPPPPPQRAPPAPAAPRPAPAPPPQPPAPPPPAPPPPAPRPPPQAAPPPPPQPAPAATPALSSSDSSSPGPSEQYDAGSPGDDALMVENLDSPSEAQTMGTGASTPQSASASWVGAGAAAGTTGPDLSPIEPVSYRGVHHLPGSPSPPPPTAAAVQPPVQPPPPPDVQSPPSPSEHWAGVTDGGAGPLTPQSTPGSVYGTPGSATGGTPSASFATPATPPTGGAQGSRPATPPRASVAAALAAAAPPAPAAAVPTPPSSPSATTPGTTPGSATSGSSLLSQRQQESAKALAAFSAASTRAVDGACADLVEEVLTANIGTPPPHIKQEARRAALRLLQGTALPLLNRALAQADLTVASSQRKRSSGGTASLAETKNDGDAPKVAIELAAMAAGGEMPGKVQLRRLSDAVLGSPACVSLRPALEEICAEKQWNTALA